MGFNKRFINEEQLIDRYRESGILGIEEYFGKTDAFIMEDELSEKVIDILYDGEMEETNKWDSISELISEASPSKDPPNETI
jgi:hypothetical protein